MGWSGVGMGGKGRMGVEVGMGEAGWAGRDGATVRNGE